MTDEMQISGKTYISSKRAASHTHYTQDYIGQLCRKGLIDAQRIAGLWYVDLESLNGYKSGAEKYTPVPPSYSAPREPEALVSFDGKEYISANRASQITGYNQDYIGQLARSGKIISRQVGNRWYLDNVALLAHKKEKDALLAAVQVGSVGIKPRIGVDSVSDKPTLPATNTDLMRYSTDSRDLLPLLSEKTSAEKFAVTVPTTSHASYSRDVISRPIPIKVMEARQVESMSSPEYKKEIPVSTIDRSVFRSSFFWALSLILVIIILYILSLRTASSGSAPNIQANTSAPVGRVHSALEGVLSWIESELSPRLDYIRVE